MVVPQVRYRDPNPGEVRPAGWAYLSNPDGTVYAKVPSCEVCADVVHVVWVEALIEDECQGCGVLLSGNAV